MGIDGTASTGRSELDRRLEALVQAASDPIAKALAGAAPDEPEDASTLEELVTELRGMREAFLSLPTLDVLEERLVAIETAVDRLTEAVSRVLGRLERQLPADEAPAAERPTEADVPAGGAAPVDAPRAADEGTAMRATS